MAIAAFFRDWAPGTLTGGAETKVYEPPVSVPGAQSRKLTYLDLQRDWKYLLTSLFYVFVMAFIMAIRVVKFSSGGYKIRKIFA